MVTGQPKSQLCAPAAKVSNFPHPTPYPSAAEAGHPSSSAVNWRGRNYKATPSQKYKVFVISALCWLTFLAYSDQKFWESHGCPPAQEKSSLV